VKQIRVRSQQCTYISASIAGACNAGVDSIFISGGIHAKDIAATNGAVDEERMLQLFQQHKVEPTYTMPSLRI